MWLFTSFVGSDKPSLPANRRLPLQSRGVSIYKVGNLSSSGMLGACKVRVKTYSISMLCYLILFYGK